MKSTIAASIRFRGLAIAAAAALMILGITQLLGAPVDSLPEFKPTIVEVQTEALGLSAEEVEQLVTVPLEQDLLNGVAYLQGIESVSLPGLSSVILTFEPGTDLLDARQVVNERLTQAVGVAGLPAVADPPQMLQPLSSTNRAAILKLSSPELSPIEVSVLARWVIGPRLLGVEGVANVSTWGLRDRQLQVLVDPPRLQEAGVTLNQVIRTTGNALEVSPLTYLEASKPGTGGFIDTANQRLQVFHEQTIKTPAELEQIPLEDEDGNAVILDGGVLTLGDVTEVVEDHQPLIGDALCSDGACQLLVIEKFPGANTVAVAEGLEEAIEAMRPGMAGLDMDTSIYRPAEYIQSAFSNMWTAVVVGAALLLLVLALFFLNWRAVLVSAGVIAVSLAAAASVLALRGGPLNLMVMAGLVMALLVVIDDTIVDVDRLTGRVQIEDDKGRIPVARRVTAALLATRSSTVYAILIIVAASVPVFFMKEVGGAFLPPIVASYLLAIGTSLIVSLTLTPALSTAFLDGDRASPSMRRIRHFYDGKISGLVGRAWPALVLFVVVAALGAVSVAVLRTSMAPQLQERDIVVQLKAAPGTSLIRMNDMTGDLVDRVAGVPGVRTVGAHVGRAVTSDQISGVNAAEIWFNLDSAAAYTETLTALEDIAGDNPELATAVLTHSQERVLEVLQRPSSDLVVRVYGENSLILDEKAAEIEQRVSRIDGIDDLRIDNPPERRTIRVTVDLASAQSVGLKPGDVRRAAAVLLNGITVGNLFEEQKVFDVVVWGRPDLRESEENIKNLLIDTDDFGPVRLGAVADIESVSLPAVIRHESVASYLDVTANVGSRSVEDVALEVEAAIDQVTFPLEHHAELLGLFGEKRTQRLLMVALWAGAAAFIFLLLQAAFDSWRLAAAVAVVLPMAVAGGLVAVWVTGGTVGLGSVAGLFVVFALSVRQSIVSIRHYQSLQRDEGVPFGPDLVVRGTRDRLGPVLVTFVAAVFFLVPFVVRGPSIGFEILQPSAVAAMGGLIATALLTLFVIPAIYLRFGHAEAPSIWGEELFDVSLSDIEDQAALGADG